MINPFDYTKPGHLFVGRSGLSHELLQGLQQQQSFAILGGRRIGKTSLLLQFQQELLQQQSEVKWIPCYVDFQSLEQITRADCFRLIYQAILNNPHPHWQSVNTKIKQALVWRGKDYDSFKAQLAELRADLYHTIGVNCRIVLLLDEIDMLAKVLTDDTFFQNLRNLLSVSEFKGDVLAVIPGVNQLANLIKGGSPLNILKTKYLGELEGDATSQLLSKADLSRGVADEISSLAGRHPYLTQGILHHTIENHTAKGSDSKLVEKAVKTFLRENANAVFEHWFDAWEPLEQQVAMALAQHDGIDITGLARRLHCAPGPLEEALLTLEYHGIVQSSLNEQQAIAPQMFRQWLLKKNPVTSTEPENKSEPLELTISDAKGPDWRHLITALHRLGCIKYEDECHISKTFTGYSGLSRVYLLNIRGNTINANLSLIAKFHTYPEQIQREFDAVDALQKQPNSLKTVLLYKDSHPDDGCIIYTAAHRHAVSMNIISASDVIKRFSRAAVSQVLNTINMACDELGVFYKKSPGAAVDTPIDLQALFGNINKPSGEKRYLQWMHANGSHLEPRQKWHADTITLFSHQLPNPIFENRFDSNLSLVLSGYQHSSIHGDLHFDNLLVELAQNNATKQVFLIDLANSQPEMPTALDFARLEVAFWLHEVPNICSDLTLADRAALLRSVFAFLNRNEPVEADVEALQGADAVISIARALREQALRYLKTSELYMAADLVYFTYFTALRFVKFKTDTSGKNTPDNSDWFLTGIYLAGLAQTFIDDLEAGRYISELQIWDPKSKQ